MAIWQQETANAWGVLHSQPRHQLRYPSEHVVRWLASLPLKKGDYAVDIGTGAGRHLRLMLELGLEAVGTDVVDAIDTFRLHEAPMTKLPFMDDTFAAALAFGVFYYGTMGDADKAVSEMYRVLKPGGHGFVSYRTNRDWHNDHIDSHGVFHLEGHPEDGMLIDSVNEDELIELFAEFSDMRWELAEWTTHDRDRLNSDWLVSVTK